MVVTALISILYYISPFFFVPMGGYMLWVLWFRYKQLNYTLTSDIILLEVILPKTLFRTPKSMEVVLGALNQGYAGNWWEKISKGTVRGWFSLEMVSLEGKVHFYIWTPRIFKYLIEAQIYAQYGDVEIRPAQDYVGLIKYGIEDGWDVQIIEEKLSKDDPYPIKTYVDYGLDKEGVDEEYKTDPITPTVEYLSALGPGQYACIQILVQATKDRYKKPGTWWGKQGWKDEGKALIEKLSGQDKKPKEGEAMPAIFKLTPGQQDILKAVERNISKIGFDCGIRMMYAGKGGAFDRPQSMALGNMFTQYTTQNLNSFKHNKNTSVKSVVAKWVGADKKKLKKIKNEMLDAYRLRSWFYPPYKREPFVLNTEELATIFHFPGGVITSSGLARIESKKSEPPTNLPT